MRQAVILAGILFLLGLVCCYKTHTNTKKSEVNTKYKNIKDLHVCFKVHNIYTDSIPYKNIYLGNH